MLNNYSKSCFLYIVIFNKCASVNLTYLIINKPIYRYTMNINTCITDYGHGLLHLVKPNNHKRANTM